MTVKIRNVIRYYLFNNDIIGNNICFITIRWKYLKIPY